MKRASLLITIILSTACGDVYDAEFGSSASSVIVNDEPTLIDCPSVETYGGFNRPVACFGQAMTPEKAWQDCARKLLDSWIAKFECDRCRFDGDTCEKQLRSWHGEWLFRQGASEEANGQGVIALANRLHNANSPGGSSEGACQVHDLGLLGFTVTCGAGAVPLWMSAQRICHHDSSSHITGGTVPTELIRQRLVLEGRYCGNQAKTGVQCGGECPPLETCTTNTSGQGPACYCKADTATLDPTEPGGFH